MPQCKTCRGSGKVMRCPKCGGAGNTGGVLGFFSSSCSLCDGLGFIPQSNAGSWFDLLTGHRDNSVSECPSCHGFGFTIF